MALDAPVRRLDRFQQEHQPAAFLFAVVKKFGDDRGGALAALLTYYGFLSLFPMLLVLFTVVSYVLPNYPSAQRSVEQSVLGQFPVIGDQLRTIAQHPLHGSIVALVAGIVALLWGVLGATQTLQFAMQEVWSVPGKDRPNFWIRLTRSLLLFAVVGLGIAATTTVSGLGTVLAWGPFGSLLAALPSAAVNTGLFLLLFRLLTPDEVATHDLLPGVLVAGIGWQVLQTIGVNLVSHQLRHSSQVYGVFGFTLALLSFLSLASQLTVYAAEVNVVRARRLWPRSLIQPPLTQSDMSVLRGLAGREARRPEEQVSVAFVPTDDPRSGPSKDS